MSSTLKVDILQDSGGNTILSSDGSGTVTQTRTGIIMLDQHRLTGDLTDPSGTITTNLGRVDDATFAQIGTGMTESSGIFSFPQTGLYEVMCNINVRATSENACIVFTQVSTDSGSTYDDVANAEVGERNSSGNIDSANSVCYINVTNISTFRIRFSCTSFTDGILNGNPDTNITYFTFKRIGDSQ